MRLGPEFLASVWSPARSLVGAKPLLTGADSLLKETDGYFVETSITMPITGQIPLNLLYGCRPALSAPSYIAALNSFIYQDNRLFAIPEGVAIVLHMEKINPDGTPGPRPLV